VGAELVFESIPDLPDPNGFGGPLVGTHGDALIVAGGANFPTALADGGQKVWHDKIFVLLPGDEAWRSEQILPRPLAYSACASTSRGVVIVGGSDDARVFSDVLLMRWNATSAQVEFEQLPPLPVPSAFGSAEAIGNTIFVLGGKQSKDDTDLSGGFWKLDLNAQADGWVSLPTHPGEPRAKMVTAIQAGPDGKPCLYMFSGSRTTKPDADHFRFEMFADGYCYSPEAQSWRQLCELPALPDPREIDGKERFASEPWPINAGSAMAFGTSQILTFSGSTGRYILNSEGEIVPAAERPFFLNRVLAYDVVDDQWIEAGTMPVGVVTTGVTLWNGSIVIASGEIKPGIRTRAVQALPVHGMAGLFSALDYTILGVYLALMVAVGVYFSRRDTTTEDFFLGGRNIPWWAAGVSIFGTQLSAITFMAIPATAYGSDWRRFVGSLMLIPILVLVIFCFLPFFRRLPITTAYEYLEARFSRVVRLMASSLFILFQLGRMGIVLLLPAIALSAVTEIDTYVCIGLMGLLATVYTTLGGISAVIWTDVVQVFVLIAGAALCLLSAVTEVGGFREAIDIGQAAGKFHMFDWSLDPSDMVAWVLIIGFLFTNLVPYTSDQTVIQRYLTTRNEKESARSLWLNLVVTIPTGLLFYGLGTALYVYYTANPIEQAMLPAKADQLVPWFVVTHLPAGIAGLIVAGIFAAAMSSLDSSMNSITTAVVSDFVEPMQATENKRDHLRLARLLTVLLGVIGTGAAMFLATYEIKYLFDFFQKLVGFFGGGLAGVFLLAVFTTRTNTRGAVLGLVAGGTATIAVAFLTDINFLLYAAVGSLTCVSVGYLTSFFCKGTPRDLGGLTLWTRKGATDGTD
jgi:SSS family transporter